MPDSVLLPPAVSQKGKKNKKNKTLTWNAFPPTDAKKGTEKTLEKGSSGLIVVTTHL